MCLALLLRPMNEPRYCTWSPVLPLLAHLPLYAPCEPPSVLVRLMADSASLSSHAYFEHGEVLCKSGGNTCCGADTQGVALGSWRQLLTGRCTWICRQGGRVLHATTSPHFTPTDQRVSQAPRRVRGWGSGCLADFFLAMHVGAHVGAMQVGPA